MVTELCSGTVEDYYKFWDQERETYTSDLIRYLIDLSTHVPINSKTPWLLQIDWKKISEREWVSLQMACNWLEKAGTLEGETANWFFRELKENLSRCKLRLKGAKHLQAVEALENNFVPFFVIAPDHRFSQREWLGNFKENIYKLLQRVFHFRLQKSPKIQRTQRVRGYRDKGTESSVSERARRAANTATWNEYLEEILAYIRMTGCSLHQALRVFDMVNLEE